MFRWRSFGACFLRIIVLTLGRLYNSNFSPPPTSETIPARCIFLRFWSIRADREEQFMSDFQTYERLECAGEDFEYVLVTNEFDAARLRAACERRRQNAPLFTHVVHINPVAVNVVYREGASEGASAVRAHIASGRLMSLQGWLDSAAATS